ncbi:MAG: GTPase HflX [Planctomycetes bacterium]|nr:GTPase HflX [Planctomycetota bacterium]
MSRLFGKTQGLRKAELDTLERLLQRRSDRSRLVGVDLARELGERAWELGRNIGVLVGRNGHVERVLVGDALGVPVPELGPSPQAGRLRGVRVVRTSLRGLTPISDEDRATLVRERLDAYVRVVIDEVGEVLWVQHAHLDPERLDAHDDSRVVSERAPQRLSALSREYPAEVTALEEEIVRRTLGLFEVGSSERALLATVHEGDLEDATRRMAELYELVVSAGFDVVAHTLQKRDRPDPRTLVGSGKLEEIARLAVKHAANLLVVDRELTGVQQRNLEDKTGLTVLDRTEVVLRIFERRARTRAAKLRVALARLRYQLPRLSVRDHGMSRIGRSTVAGVGTRGKGERRIDLDRRQMRDRIHRLESLLARVAKQQRTRHRARMRSRLPMCSLVGYTNAGKSTWLNALADAEVLVEDRLFATLDTSVRRTRLPGGHDVLIADTVGFLRDLPEGLVDAFRSTLDELAQSDLLIHVVDIAADDAREKEESVLETLDDLGASGIPVLTLWNKADRIDRDGYQPLARAHGALLVSANERDDRIRVREAIESMAFDGERAESPDHSSGLVE